jgi:4-alpha-glucanotransferase
MLLDRRRSGVLLHPTSLPSRYGIGDLGPGAYHFLDFLVDARQTLWQILPIGPTGFGNSPYASPSAFAGNPLLIAPDLLLEAGLLEPTDVADLTELPADFVDFARLVPLKMRLLEVAFARGGARLRDEVAAFRQAHAGWVEDFALYAALKDDLASVWTAWEPGLRAREPGALAAARARLADRLELHVFSQYLFTVQWSTLRVRARERGIAIVGDIPIFVAHDSADVWANQHLFKLDAHGQPTVMAGVPPDYFSVTGQLWGNPLYDWVAMRDEGYAWWIGRFQRLMELVDLIRVDHFRGFESAWEVPAGATTAVAGTWVKGPGADVFHAIAAACGGGQPAVIAEDLGLITDDVRELLQVTRFPGMKVLQFAFGDGPRNPYLPHNFNDPNCVVYTGTHDNDTTRGWLTAAPEHERRYAQRYLGSTAAPSSLDVVRAALASAANTAIVPLQDILDLDSGARMNRPGALHGNWTWRVSEADLDTRHATCLADLTETYGRAQADQ